MLIEISISSNLQKIIAGLSPENIKSAMKAGMQNVLSDVEARAVKITPVRSSNLVNSISSFVADGGTSGILKATAKYAEYVHEGTGLYGPYKTKIVPRNKQALFWKGALHPVRSTKGMKGNPFFTKARNQVNASKLFEEGVNNFLLRKLR